jgi:hypothetical protein
MPRYKAAWRSVSFEGAAEVSPVRKRRVFSEKQQRAAAGAAHFVFVN